jgi:hypothetical protein
MTASGASTLYDQMTDIGIIDLIPTSEDSFSSALRTNLEESNCTMAVRMLSTGTTLSS